MENIKARVWFDLIGYEGFYLISTDGEFMNLKNGKILKQDINKGYKRVTLSKNGKINRYMSHRLVAFNFIKNVDNKKYVNHKNGNKSDNNIHNLEWVTASENERHSFDVLGKKPNGCKIILNTQNGIFYDTIADAAKSINHKMRTLSAKLSGQNKNNTYFIYA